ncbi:hypothetical protein OV208_18455 [Corallococcus sp. bb12-1]|uniref:hypothetical protein n=1 Tax=Corallococcus sp. bb12-1 TaxID=2996784 RepID=UPI00226F9B54|nr:hypothetical protein [Corallococcus sp. bb12-1]MCY1043305.1 hypothetical protein [Corallococcus sp. bb12-1]
MNTACAAPTRARIIGVTVPQPWAWAAMVRNTPVLNLPQAPPADILGQYVAVCAAGYEEGLAAWMALHAGVGSPPVDELPTGAVVAVARVAAVSAGTEAPRESRWYDESVGLWLEDVVALPEPVACTPGTADCLWELPALVLAQVRLRYLAVTQASDARWLTYEALAARSGGREPATLKDRVLRKCTCRRAMTPCPTCRAWRCTAPTCPPHTCGQEARLP